MSTTITEKLGVLKSSQTALEDIEEDERNQGLIFDEAQFEMDGREYLEIEYMSGDIYRGELQGQSRHGFGMFIYKQTGDRVIGIWKNHFMMKEDVKHPLESCGELVPLSVSKYEGRAKKSSGD